MFALSYQALLIPGTDISMTPLTTADAKLFQTLQYRFGRDATQGNQCYTSVGLLELHKRNSLGNSQTNRHQTNLFGMKHESN